MDYRLSEGFTVLRNGNIQARSKKSLKRADFKRVLGTLFNRPLSFFYPDAWFYKNMTIYGPGTGCPGQNSPDISSRRGFIPVSLKFKIWPSQHLMLYVIIDCNQSAYKKIVCCIRITAWDVFEGWKYSYKNKVISNNRKPHPSRENWYRWKGLKLFRKPKLLTNFTHF